MYLTSLCWKHTVTFVIFVFHKSENFNVLFDSGPSLFLIGDDGP